MNPSTQTLTLHGWALAPALAPVLGMLLVLVLDALLPQRRTAQVGVAGGIGVPGGIGMLALIAGAAAATPGALGRTEQPVLSLCLPSTRTVGCFWSAGPTASTLQIAILAGSLAVLLLMVDHGRGDAVDVTLLLASAAGGVAVSAAQDLPSWLVAFELATVPVVALVALRGTGRALHGAFALLLPALLSFALLVLGVAFWVTATGDPTFSEVAVRAAWADPASRGVLVLAVLTMLAGVGFKLSAVPFHAWTPITWSGGPLPVSALLVSASKLSAVAALLVVVAPFAQAFGPSQDSAPHVLAFALGALALSSMLLGTVVAMRASDVLRLLAWSTIAQAGWVLLPLAALSAAGMRAAAGYALTYAAAALVALAAVSSVTGRDLTAYKGLIRTHPHVGLPLALALLTLAGLPPGVLGLVAKIAALRPVLAAGLWPLAAAAVVGVVLGLAVYLRWLAVLLAAPDREEAAPGEGPVALGRGAMAVLALGTSLLVVASLWPHLLFGLLR